MEAKLLGHYFKVIIGGMLGSSLMFPEYKKRVDEMDPQATYPWKEYCKMINDIAAKLSPVVLTNLGQKIMAESKDIYIQYGFDSTETILKDYYAFTKDIFPNAPAEDYVRTKSFEPGYAVIDAGLIQPAGLVEGYIKGIITCYGNKVVSITCQRAEGPPYPVNRFEVKWRKA